MRPVGLPVVVFLHPSDELYGADRQLLVLVRTAKSICRPIVLLPNSVDGEGRLAAELRAEGIEIRRGPLSILRRSYLRPSTLPRWAIDAGRGLWWLLCQVRALRPATVVTNTTAIPAGPIVAALLGIPHVWYVRELIEHPAWYAPLVRNVARLPRGIIVTNSVAVARWLGRVPRREVRPVHNGVTPSEGVEPLDEAPAAVFVGRLNEWKGWQIFVGAAETVHDRLPAARFVLAGGTVPNSTIDDSSVASTLRAVDPEGRWLRWVGEVADARPVMQKCWVVVVPSVRPEPFGNVVVEGMAEGRSVIGTNAGGIPEIVIDGETGLLVEPGSVEALADALVTVLSDRALAERMGRAALARYEREFTPGVHATAWLAALSEVLSCTSR